MNQRLVLFAKHILAMDRPQAIEDGFVIVQGSRILQVGRRKDLYFLPSVRMLDLGDTVLLPGFINAHCHLDYTSWKGRVPYRGNFREWLRRMAEKTQKTPASDFRRSVQKGIQESLAYGTTTLCDVSTSWESGALLRRSGLRAYVFLEMLDVGQSSTRHYWKVFLEKFRRITHEIPATATFHWGLGPHTPFTVSKELWMLAGGYLADHKDLLTTVHAAESREEAFFFKEGRGHLAERLQALNPDWVVPRKTTPVRYLNDCGWLPKLDLAVHLNTVEERDLNLLSKNRIAVVHCPGSHAYFRHPLFSYKKFRQRRIPVCLGTDSLASNRSLSLFREMRLFKRNHPSVSSHEVLSMVTVNPARALGEGSRLGQIRPGFLADLIGVPVSRGRGFSARTLQDQVLEHKGEASFAMIHGELKFRLT